MSAFATIGAHALTCAVAVILADRVAASRRRQRDDKKATHVARLIASEREPTNVFLEIARQVAIGRASFLAPDFKVSEHPDAGMRAASAALNAVNRELIGFGAMIEAPLGTIDANHVCALWADFTKRRRAAHDRLRARRRELLERCPT